MTPLPRNAVHFYRLELSDRALVGMPGAGSTRPSPLQLLHAQPRRVANPFGVTVMSGGGFDSLTDKHNFAAALSEHDRPTEVLHIGNHDPSGVSMFLAFLEDVEAFTRELGGQATFTRLTPAQIREHRLPTSPPKATDNRAFAGETCQAEALPPDVLADILRTAIEERVDRRVLDRVRRQEQRIRRELIERFTP